jgi:hypothetical protein
MRPISPSRVASLSLMVFAFIALHVDPAAALLVDMKKVSRGSLQASCDKAGGTFSTNSTGYYGCEKKNCDGKGGICEVNCSDSGKTCTGVTPLKQRPILAKGIAGVQQLLPASHRNQPPPRPPPRDRLVEDFSTPAARDWAQADRRRPARRAGAQHPRRVRRAAAASIEDSHE